jgi:hypothetical protein
VVEERGSEMTLFFSKYLKSVMADPKTDINESLCCIALRYIDKYPTNNVDDFVDMITTEGKKPEEWSDNGVLENLQIGRGKFRTHSTYRSAYGQKDSNGNLKYETWIKGSFYSAQSIRKKLNVVLSQYVISRPDKEENNKAFVIKEQCTSAIKNWASVFDRTDIAKVQRWSRGILSNLNSDKINIADIMLIHKNSEIYDELDEIQKITNNIKWKDVSDNPSIIKKLLTPKKYNEYMNRAWLIKDIFNISLKQVLSENFPLKLINLDRNSAKEYDSDLDEFQFLLTSLVGAAKSGSLSNFENLIKKTIDLKPVIFSANDRLEVKYKLNIKNLNLNKVKSYDYTMWTNFGGGQNSVYFSQAGSGSASGEGGITLTYFSNLVKNIPKLRTFLTYMKLKRKEYFDAACKKYSVNFSDSKMGDSSLSNVKYNSFLYTSNDFKKLVHILLTDTEPVTQEDVITPIKYITKSTGEVIINDGQKLTKIDYRSMLVLEEFFNSYVNFLSNNSSQMGTYFGLSERTKKTLISQGRRTYEKFDQIYQREVLSKKKTKLDLKKYEELKKEITKIKGDTSTETIKLKRERISNAISLTESEIKSIKQFSFLEAKNWKRREYKNFEEKYKKGFALLANAEFGYMYSEYADKINELVKKQVLLSLYAAASGRGYIIFEGKKFEMDDYFEKDVKGAPYLKVGM